MIVSFKNYIIEARKASVKFVKNNKYYIVCKSPKYAYNYGDEWIFKVKDGDDKDTIQKAYDGLSESIQKVGAAMYEQPGAEQATGNEEPKAEEGPVEGEVVDEENK